MSSTPGPGPNSERFSADEPPTGDVADFVWRTKYRATGEHTITDSWRRIARAIAGVETEPLAWEGRFLAALEDFRFLPGGRIQAGAGTGQGAVLFNCFVLPGPTESLDGSLASLQETILTLRAGGGVGLDFSAVPPRGWRRDGGAPSPGPVALLEVWDSASRAFLANVPRRGAMMGALACDHPDVLAFADAKRAPGRLTRFNLSVAVSDAFMAAVRAGEGWTLRFGDGAAGPTVPAGELWSTILRSAYDTGEPGVLFIDRINRGDNLGWRERIAVTNPCGEVPLPEYGACVLGSLNLPRFVLDPFTPQARLDEQALARTAATAVRMLDDVIELSAYPLPQQAHAARGSRRIGLGVTGLADALVMLGLRYGAPGSLEAASRLMRTIRDAAYRASIDLARERGAFPQFDRDPFLAREFIRSLPADIRDGIAAHGLRNSHLLAIAPTGSISLLAGGVSSGLEPIFAPVQARTILAADGAPRRFEIVDPALALWRRLKGVAVGEPPGFVVAHDLEPADHTAMQAALQPFVDNAISKTVNIAADLPFEDFRAVFDGAFEKGLKGCTAFRAGGGRDVVLSDVPPTCPA